MVKTPWTSRYPSTLRPSNRSPLVKNNVPAVYSVTPSKGIYTNKQVIGPTRKRLKNGEIKEIPMIVKKPKKLMKLSITPDLKDLKGETAKTEKSYNEQ